MLSTENFEKLLNDCLNNNNEALEAIIQSNLNDDQIHLMQLKVTAALDHEPDNSNALFLEGRMHQLGQGKPVNFSEAIRIYELAIAKGNDGAMAIRASMHQNGQGGTVNYPEAIRLYELAIARGNDDAMTDRALMHKRGKERQLIIQKLFVYMNWPLPKTTTQQ